MAPFDPIAFAHAWAEAWNQRDTEAVLAHFAEDVTFSTPVAVQTVGKPTVRGKSELRAYWLLALGRITSLHFTVVRSLWDPERRELGIVYDREVNGRSDRALELLAFNPAGEVVSGEVFYGVVPSPGPG